MEINAETQWRRLSSWAINYNVDHKHIWFPCVSFVYESLVNSFFCCFVVTLVTIILGLVMFWLKKILAPGPRSPPCFRQTGNLGLGAQFAPDSGPGPQGPSRVEPAYLTCVQLNLTYKVPGIKFIVELTNCFGKFSTYGFAPGWTYPKFVIKIILTWIHFKQNSNYKTKQNI